MTAPRSAWRRLGISPTREVAAIRSAYAATLKSIDPDSDPAAFEALREAREQALAHARQSPEAYEAEALAPDQDIDVPTTSSVIHSLIAPILALGTPPGAIVASIPGGSGDFLSFAQSIPVNAVERLVPLDGLGGSLTPPLIRRVSAIATIETLAPGASTAHEVHSKAVLGILFGEEGRQQPLTDDTMRRELFTHVEALLRDPQMQEISFYANAERWFAQVMAASAPRSDAVLSMVIDHFGWLADRGRIDQAPQIAQVVARHDTLAFRAAVQKKDHPLHRAWRELTTPANETSRRGFVSGKKVGALLTVVRSDYPDLEQAFDFYRVSLWEDGSIQGLHWSATSRASLSFFGVVMVMLIRIIPFESNTPSTMPQYVPPAIDMRQPTYGGPEARDANGVVLPPMDEILISPEHDIDDALRAVTGDTLTYARLTARNPTLSKILDQKWHSARESDQTRTGFRNALNLYLQNRFFAGLRKANYALASDYMAFRRDEARLAGARSVHACSDYLRNGTLPMSRSPQYEKRRAAMIGRGLVETNVEPSDRGEYVFSIPPGTYDIALAKSGLTQDRFKNALHQKGTADEQCKARIALMEAAIAVPPKIGLKLLRDM